MHKSILWAKVINPFPPCRCDRTPLQQTNFENILANVEIAPISHFATMFSILFSNNT